MRSGWPPTCCRGRPGRHRVHDVEGVRDSQPPWPACQGRGEIRAHRHRVHVADPRQPRRQDDGWQEHHGHPAAGRSGGGVEREVHLLHGARDQSKQQLQDIRGRLTHAPASELAALFDAQLLMLDDQMLVGRAEHIVRTERVNAAWAVHRANEELYQLFSAMEDPYLRERENDVADVAGRLRMNLRHGARGPRELLSQLDGPSVLIADELTASVAAQLDWSRVQGFATDAGSRTYHTAILARSLKVPAIVGLHDASLRIAAGTPIVLDGKTGELVVSPTPEVIEDAQRRAARPKRRGTGAEAGPVSTTEGVRIRLEANV